MHLPNGVLVLWWNFLQITTHFEVIWPIFNMVIFSKNQLMNVSWYTYTLKIVGATILQSMKTYFSFNSVEIKLWESIFTEIESWQIPGIAEGGF